MKNINKQVAMKHMINKGLNASSKKMISFRIDVDVIEKLQTIANKKKATQTKVITELIQLAYVGLNTQLGDGLNEIYRAIVNEAKRRGIVQKKLLKTKLIKDK